jgi:PAS domain S-box-containing protein
MASSSKVSVGDWLAFLLSTASDNAIVVVDPAGTIVSWMGGAERRFGYSKEEAVGLDFGVLFTLEDRQQGLDRQEMAVAAATNRSEDDRWHVRKDGSRFWGSGLLEAVRESDGSVSAYCKVLRDRTDVRARVDALQNRLAVRERDDVQRIESLIAIGHELRNSLGSVQNATSVLSASTEEPTRSKCLLLLQRQLSSMEVLLQDLEASVGTVALPRLRLQEVVVQDALELAENSVRQSIKQKRQELLVTAPDVPFSIQVDPARLQQMLLNLLANASKYTPSGGHIHLTATIEGIEVIIRVTDDGVGISHIALPRIFDLLTRGDQPTPEVPGMGVGLAVVKELATLHGGGVEARSPGQGKGSVFTLRLPVAGPARIATDAATSPPPHRS